MAAMRWRALLGGTLRLLREPLKRLAPHLFGCINHELQFALLVVLREGIPDRDGGEPTLRAERQLLHRYVFGRLFNATQQIVLRLQRSVLRADQPKHDCLTLGDKP